MPIKFDFISPDIVVSEVDQSIIPPEPGNDGILIIGQAMRGPAMKPVRVKSIADLETVFGETNSGVNPSADIWRAGNDARPSYGLYAAKAWLASETSPVTYVRLAGDTTATTTTKAGWNLGGAAASTTANQTTLAYGLWICPSASAEEITSGSLAAIIYTKGASLALRGQMAGTTGAPGLTSSAGVLIESDASSNMAGFTLDVWTGNNPALPSFSSKAIHFDPTAGGFIREKLNTDPQKLQSGQKSSDEVYFLGETFETELYESLKSVGSASAGKQYGIIMPLSSGSIAGSNWVERNRKVTAAKTGYFVENYSGPNGGFVNTALKKLFRLVSLHEGEEFQKKYYVEIGLHGIQSITTEYSSFVVRIKNIIGEVQEEYKCNLNPNSDNFIAKRIGDQYLEYNTTKKKFITKGEFPNVSSLVRVEMHPEYSEAANNSLPFGFYGPYKPKHFTITSGSAAMAVGGSGVWAVSAKKADIYAGHDVAGQFAVLHADVTASFSWPELKLTDANSNSGTGRFVANGEAVGVRNYRRDIGDSDHEIYEIERSSDYLDLVRNYQEDLDPHKSGGNLELSYIFSLDELKEGTANNGDLQFVPGSKVDGTSYSALYGNAALINLASPSELKMVAPFFGGFDGVNIEHVNPFKKDLVTGKKGTNYEYEAVDRVLDFAASPEYLQYDLIAMPGITNTTLLRKLAQNTANRADALAILDIDSGFTGKHERAAGEVLGQISTVETAMNTLRFNNSYAATYYPEVVIQDNGKVTVPSSIAGIGAIAKSEAATGAPWFAPAGFNRGGISVLGGSAGPVVSSPAETLTKAERDRLYLVNVNPIANFPGEGPVVFGQKTLQRTASALDRINVRRLLIHLKKRIGAVARSVLFDANLQATWNRFVASATPILQEAQSGFGIAEYKLILDETTTTPDLVDRNIMYAQIYIKPAYAIEFIAIDFVITRSGIEF